MRISETGLKLIADFEGCELAAYPDPGSGGAPWTIGFGHTAGVKPGDTCTHEQAMAWLRADVANAEGDVSRLVSAPLAQHQFDALVSFTFNLGGGNLAKSTLLRRLNSQAYAEVGRQFDVWNRGPQGVMPGLVRRRAVERALFEGRGYPASG